MVICITYTTKNCQGSPFWHCIFQSYYHHMKIIFTLTVHLYGTLIIDLSCTPCTISTRKGQTMYIWYCMAMCFYKQQYFSRCIVKLCLKLTNCGKSHVRRRLSEYEMNRGIEMLETGRSQRHFAHVLGGITEHCLKDVDPIPNDLKCLAGHATSSQQQFKS
jgi:hypothetical protein